MSAGERAGFRFRSSYLVAAAAAFFAAVVALGWLVGANYARESQENVLSAASDAFGETMEDCYSRILAFLANRLVLRLGTARACSVDEMCGLADCYGVNEFNVADSNGVCVASTEAENLGYDFRRSPETEVYVDMLRSRGKVVVQRFRPSVEDPTCRRKYLGLPFPDGSGFVQLGIDESRFASEYDRLFFDYFSVWKDARICFFVVADRATGRVLEYSLASDKRVAESGSLSDLGFGDLETAPEGSVRLFGESCRYRSVSLLGRRFIAVVLDREYYHVRTLFVLLPTFLLTLVIGCAALVLRVVGRAKRAELRLRAARRFQERAERRRHLADLALARDIQRSSLPSVFPSCSRGRSIDLFADMVPARDVGGDFYDFFETGGGRLAVVVADVSGKGVPAAMFMMKAKSVLRELVQSIDDLGEAVSQANERLCEGNEADMFVTCWVGVFDEVTGELRYVNAGHNPPYLCRADRTLEPMAKVSGLFLGGMPGVRYGAFAERLSPGDLLFLYTDGVTEANNVLGELFGESRLEEVLSGRRGLGLSRFMSGRYDPLQSPSTLCHHVRGAVDAFAGKAAQFDDITLLAFRYRGQPNLGEGRALA